MAKFKEILFGKKTPPSVEKFSTLSPEQQALMGQISTRFQDRLSQPFSAPASRGILEGIAQEGDVGFTLSPEQEAEYQRGVVDPTMRTYQRDILSKAVGELGAAGHISSSARERALLGSAERMQDQLAQQRLSFMQGNQQAKLQSKQLRVSAAQALAQAEGTPDEEERYMGYVANLLGIPTMGYVGFQGQQTPGIAGDLLGMAGMAMGMPPVAAAGSLLKQGGDKTATENRLLTGYRW